MVTSKLINTVNIFRRPGPHICPKCSLELKKEDLVIEVFGMYWHETCYNPYEHYYGLNKPID